MNSIILDNFLWEYHTKKIANLHNITINQQNYTKTLYLKLYYSYINIDTCEKGFINNHFCMGSLNRLWEKKYSNEIKNFYYTNKPDYHNYLISTLFMNILAPDLYYIYLYINFDENYSLSLNFYNRIKNKSMLTQTTFLNNENLNKWNYIKFGPLQIKNSKFNMYTYTKYKLELLNVLRTSINFNGIKISHALLLPSYCNI